jgi:hypothetical protein
MTMNYQQVRDVVGVIRKAHQQLRDALEEPRCRSNDDRAQKLLAALRQGEQQLQMALARFGANGNDGLLDTWLQYVPEEDLHRVLSHIEFTPRMSADDIVVRKLEFDQALIAFLRQLRDQTSIPRVEEFFGVLVQYAESQAADEAWSIRRE